MVFNLKKNLAASVLLASFVSGCGSIEKKDNKKATIPDLTKNESEKVEEGDSPFVRLCKEKSKDYAPNFINITRALGVNCNELEEHIKQDGELDLSDTDMGKQIISLDGFDNIGLSSLNLSGNNLFNVIMLPSSLKRLNISNSGKELFITLVGNELPNLETIICENSNLALITMLLDGLNNKKEDKLIDIPKLNKLYFSKADFTEAGVSVKDFPERVTVYLDGVEQKTKPANEMSDK